MTTLHSLLVYLHIAAGAVALALFWVPVIAKKGSPVHVRTGRIYVLLMYTVSISAFIASIMVLIDPIGIRRPDELPDPEHAVELANRFRMFSLFLLMLSVLVFTSIRHGLAALAERTRPGTLSRSSHRLLILTLGALAIVVAGIGAWNGQLLLIIFGGISGAGAFTMFRAARNRNLPRRELLFAHLNGLIGSGIGAYTAFFAFGGSRLLGELLTGQWQVIPWVLPAIIGTIAISKQRRRLEGRNRGRTSAGY